MAHYFKVKNAKQSHAIIKYLLSLNYRFYSQDNVDKILSSFRDEHVYIQITNEGYIYGYREKDFNTSSKSYQELTINDVFEKLEPFKEKKIINVKLNDEYTAEVSLNGVKVGCQTFPLDKAVELYKAVEEVQK